MGIFKKNKKQCNFFNTFSEDLEWWRVLGGGGGGGD